MLSNFIGVIILIHAVFGQVQYMLSQAQWKELEYDFPTPADRNQALASKEYIRGRGVPIDVAVDYKCKNYRQVFVTIPRFVGGVPITFGTLNGTSGPGGPYIRSYPSYAWNNKQGLNCAGFTSVFRVAIDDCCRLWVLDAGKIGDVQSCPPQLVIFNLATDTMIRRYQFPSSQYICTSLFITPVVDVRNPTPGTPTTCPTTMVYIADVTGFALIVYNFQTNYSWRIRNKEFYPNPTWGTFTIAGESFDLMDGLFSMALSTPSQSVNRMLYFHAVAGASEVAVPLRLIDNSTIWTQDPEALPRSFVQVGFRGAQSTAQAMDRNGNLFFGLISPIGIGCWNTQIMNERVTLVAQNNQTLQFSSGLKIVINAGGCEELWAVTNRFQKVMTGSMSLNEINFRMLVADIPTLLNGNTICRPAY